MVVSNKIKMIHQDFGTLLNPSDFPYRAILFSPTNNVNSIKEISIISNGRGWTFA